MRKLTLIVAFALASTACHSIPDAKHVAEILIDCTVDAIEPKIDALVDTLRPLVQIKAPKMSEAFAIAKQAGKEIGGCALARIAQEVLSNRGSPPDTEDGWAIDATLEKFRVEIAGGKEVSFEVEIDGRRVRL